MFKIKMSYKEVSKLILLILVVHTSVCIMRRMTTKNKIYIFNETGTKRHKSIKKK